MLIALKSENIINLYLNRKHHNSLNRKLNLILVELGNQISDLLVALVLVIAKDCHVEPHPSIKNFVEDLEHTWANSKKWVLELRGGR